MLCAEHFGRTRAGLIQIRNQLQDLYGAVPPIVGNFFQAPQEAAALSVDNGASQPDKQVADTSTQPPSNPSLASSSPKPAAEPAGSVPSTDVGISGKKPSTAEATQPSEFADKAANVSSSSTVATTSADTADSKPKSVGLNYQSLVQAGFQSYDQSDVGLEYLAGRDRARREAKKAQEQKEAALLAKQQKRQKEDIERQAYIDQRIQMWAAEQATIRRVFHNDGGETITKGRPSRRMQKNHDRYGRQPPTRANPKERQAKRPRARR